MSQFFTLLTKTGQGLLANAIAYGEPLTIAEMVIGDGGGKLPSPDASVTRLVNEVRRGPINQTTTDPDNPNWTVVEQVLPPDVGGWTIREVGLYDTDGNLIAYGNYPETYKPQLSEGSARTQTIRFVMEVTDTSAVTLKIDPSVVMASRKYVDDSIEKHAKSRNHPDADTKNKGVLRFATLAESKKGEEAKAAQTPAGGMAQIDDHRNETTAHNADQIGLKSPLSVFGETVKTVQGVLASLGAAARAGIATQDEVNAARGDNVVTASRLGVWAKLGVESSFGQNGYLVLPTWLGGFIFQWGEQTNTNTVASDGSPNSNYNHKHTYVNWEIKWPISFPRSCFFAMPMCKDVPGGPSEGSEMVAAIGSCNVSGMAGKAPRITGTNDGNEKYVLTFFAIGR